MQNMTNKKQNMSKTHKKKRNKSQHLPTSKGTMMHKHHSNTQEHATTFRKLEMLGSCCFAEVTVHDHGNSM